jgi:hypothetical protein
MAYTTDFKGSSSDVARYDRDVHTSSAATSVDQKNTTAYWQAQGKQAITRAWTVSTTEPSNS